MKRLLRRGAALVLCACALVLTLSAALAARETVYFMAVNDTPLDLNAATMPTRVGGVLYVPYTMFSASATGVNLGVFAAYNTARGQVLVYSNQMQLIFDLVENTARDMDGRRYSSTAMVRGSTVFLPISLVCTVFSDRIWYTISNTRYGVLVRVKNSSVILDDRSFIDAADSRMSSMLSRYLQEAPSASPSSSPAPSSSPSPSLSPSPSPTPSQAPLSGRGAQVCLAFTLTAPEGADPATGIGLALDALERAEVRGLFLFTPAELTGRDDLVRRVLGGGHLVGIRLTAADSDEALRELEEGCEALARVARCRPCAVLAEGLDGEGMEPLLQAGWPCWQTTADGRDLTGAAAERAGDLLRRLAPGEGTRNLVLLDAGAGGTLRAVLEALTDADFLLQTPLPTYLRPTQT